MTRRILFQLHLWCALIVGLFLVFQSITGSFVAFRHAGNHLLHADEMLVEPLDAPIIPMSRVLESFSSTFPDIPHNVLSFLSPQALDEAYFVRVWDSRTGAQHVCEHESLYGRDHRLGQQISVSF